MDHAYHTVRSARPAAIADSPEAYPAAASAPGTVWPRVHQTQARTPKTSYRWYRDLIAAQRE